MSDDVRPPPPPPPSSGREGWHPDPLGIFTHRFHDGSRWTEFGSHGDGTVIRESTHGEAATPPPTGAHGAIPANTPQGKPASSRLNKFILGAVIALFTLVFLVGGAIELAHWLDPDYKLDQLREAIDDDSDQVLTLKLEGTTLLVEAYLRYPDSRGGPAGFSDEAADIAQDVADRGIDYDQLEIAYFTNLIEPDGSSTRQEVVRASWTRSTVDETGWFLLNQRDFLFEDSVVVTVHDPGFETGLLVAPAANAGTASTTPPPAADTAPVVRWCVEEDGAIRINRSCFTYWPLTVEQGELRCEDYDVYFVDTDGNRYGVNGNASGKDEFLDLETIKTNLYAERGQVQSFIDLASTLPDCEIGITDRFPPPTASETTVPEPQLSVPTLGQIAGVAICEDSAGDLHIGRAPGSSTVTLPTYLDLAKVVVEVSRTTVEVHWTMHADIPLDLGELGASSFESGSWVLYVSASDIEGLPPEASSRSLILAVDVSSDGIRAAHEGSGDDQFSYGFGRGQHKIEGDTVSAKYLIDELGEIPAEFEWSAQTDATFVPNPEDASDYTIFTDDACGDVTEGSPFPQQGDLSSEQ